MGLSACKSEGGVVPTKEDVPEPRDIECPQWICEELLIVQGDDILDMYECLGWTEEYGWGEEEPPLWLSCTNPYAEEPCEITTHLAGVEGETDDCSTGCAEGTAGSTVDDDCCFEADEQSEMLDHMYEDDEWGDGDVQILLYGCEIFAERVIECEFIGGESELSTTECSSPSIAMTPGADYIVEVDEAGSYLTVHSSGSQDTVPLSGVGAVGAGPAEFLSAIVDTTETMDLGNDDWHDWRLWFTADIAMNISSGSFTVPYAQGYQIKARGQVNGTKLPAAFEPLANATGQFNNSTGTWYLNYSSTFPGGWVQIHLEGPFYGTSSP
jgi:hypothetical protein